MVWFLCARIWPASIHSTHPSKSIQHRKTHLKVAHFPSVSGFKSTLVMARMNFEMEPPEPAGPPPSQVPL